MVTRLFRIELRKQVTSSGFWILVALHGIVLVLITSNFSTFLENANIMVNDLPEVDFSLKPILQFPDIWQNITYIAGFFKIILALIVITSICNEFTHGTARQNIVDGFSRHEWVMSKIGLLKLLAFVSTLLVIVIGLIIGYSQGSPESAAMVISRLDFVLAYFIELVVYFIYAMFLALVLKRTGLSLILLLVYDFILEPILSWTLPDVWGERLPMSTIDNLNKFPFTRYVNNEVAATVSIEQLAWAIFYGILFSLFTYLIFVKRDIK